jgi:hypothetical protein
MDTCNNTWNISRERERERERVRVKEREREYVILRVFRLSSEAYDVCFYQNQLTDIWNEDEVVDLVEYADVCIRMLTIRMLTYA